MCFSTLMFFSRYKAVIKHSLIILSTPEFPAFVMVLEWQSVLASRQPDY